MNFKQILIQKAQKYPDKPAIIFRDNPITFKELYDFSYRVSANLAALGIKKGDRVAIFLPNIPQYIYSFFGIFIIRAVALPLDFMLTEEEVVNFLKHSESKILVTHEKKGIDYIKIKERCPNLNKIIFFGESASLNNKDKDFLPWGRLLEESAVLPEATEGKDEPCAIFYTSGSTGHPKGVVLNYMHLKNPIEVLEYFIQPSDKDIFICAGVPFSHVGGLDYLLFMLYFASTLILLERFNPLEFLKGIEKHKVTIFCIVPAMYVAVLSLKEYDKHDLSSLKYAVVFGAPSSPVLLERFHKACPNAYLLNGWGMTETSAPNTFLPTGTNTKEIEHTGKFPPGTEAKLVDMENNELKGEAEGELWIKSKAVMRGYYKEPKLTEEVLTLDGWLKTGDIARRDSLGRYSIVGRKKEMIKVAGEIVFCPEVEEAIHRHPKVKEVAVIGVADKLRGEVPKAFICPKENEQLCEEEIRYFLREHLAHFKIPHYFEFLTHLPKNRIGKIDKESLKK